MWGKELRTMSKPRMGFNIYLNLIAVSEAAQKTNSQIYYVVGLITLIHALRIGSG